MSASNTSCEWRGVPISQIIGAESPWDAPEFPRVRPSCYNTVLYYVSSNGLPKERPPKPKIGKDVWDHDHVRMPFSTQNLYPIINSIGDTELKSRWDLIKKSLNRPIKNSKELANAILSYNTKFRNKWKFTSLHKLFEEHVLGNERRAFFDVTLPEMVKLALALPELVQEPIPLMRQTKTCSVTLSQQQISSLLANAFFCTFPRRNTKKRDSEYASYPDINFSGLYECAPVDQVIEKLKFLCHYFRRVCTTVPTGVVTVYRREGGIISWQDCHNLLEELRVHVDSKNTIEEAHGLIQVDFANRFIGGGVLGYGAVQEEIRFVICPELLISMLFTESLAPRDAVLIIGCEQYSKYTGYASGLKWAGDNIDQTPYDSSGRRRCAVLAIDALPCSTLINEYDMHYITRELNKAWIGFAFHGALDAGLNFPGVATGNWGCGAFGGSTHLKVLIQMMALTMASRPMAYYTFGDVELRDDIIRMYKLFVKNEISVAQLYMLIYMFCDEDIDIDIFTYLRKTIKKRSAQKKRQLKDNNVNTQNYELPVQEDLRRSPDMFTQEDNDVQLITSSKSKTQTVEYPREGSDEKNSTKLTGENVISVSDHEMGETSKTSTVKLTDDSVITISDHEMGETSKTSTIKLTDESAKSTSDHEMSETSRTSNLTSRLFDEMEKLDSYGAKLNLKSLQKSFFGQKTKEPETSMDISSNAKKMLTKKITDYFSKKPN